ncbi:MAG: metalloregulator ArsR/SmtB family transcription factor [Chloroflexota bacterium]
METAIKAIAHPGRRTILRLVWSTELTASELAQRAGMSRPGASQHLRLLREVGLVRVRTDANRRLYRVDHERLHQLRAFLEEFWGARLELLKEVAERVPALPITQATGK